MHKWLTGRVVEHWELDSHHASLTWLADFLNRSAVTLNDTANERQTQAGTFGAIGMKSLENLLFFTRQNSWSVIGKNYHEVFHGRSVSIGSRIGRSGNID